MLLCCCNLQQRTERERERERLRDREQERDSVMHPDIRTDACCFRFDLTPLAQHTCRLLCYY